MSAEMPERIVPGTKNWNKYYSGHIQRYEFASVYCTDKNDLDVACGVGYGSHLLSRKGAKADLTLKFQGRDNGSTRGDYVIELKGGISPKVNWGFLKNYFNEGSNYEIN